VSRNESLLGPTYEDCTLPGCKRAVHRDDCMASSDTDVKSVIGCGLLLVVLGMLQGKSNGGQKVETNQKLTKI